MKFDELHLDGAILEAVDRAGFESCTPVQARSIPEVLAERDVMVQSQTGTGKTAAFLLPAFQLLLHSERFADKSALVVAPTRELAVQIKDEADLLGESLPLESEVFYGGVGYKRQHEALADGVRVMVGTPGRLLDLNQTQHLDLKQVGIVIIDEADRLFDMGFYPDIRKMLRRMRPREERLNMLFSATLSTKARNIAWEHMNEPVEIEIEPENITVDAISQTLYHVASEDKTALLLGVLEREKPKSAIVFTNTKRMAEELAQRLEYNGYPSEFIIGDLPQKKRLAIIKRLKAGESEFLVATDVAARGLHIDNLELVINYDLPEDPEAYVHRIGRTARAGESGRAVALACPRYVYGLEAIETLLGRKIPVAELEEGLLAADASRGKYIDRSASGSGDRYDSRPGGGRSRRDDRSGSPRRRSSSQRERSDRSRPRQEAGRAADTARSSAGGSSRRSADTRSAEHQSRAVSRSSAKRGGKPQKRKPVAGAGGPSAGDSLEKRLAYYREKYGEDFQPTDEMLASMSTSGGRKNGAGGKQRRRSAPPRNGSGSNARAQQAKRTSKPKQAEAPPAAPDDKKRSGGVWSRLRRMLGGNE